MTDLMACGADPTLRNKDGKTAEEIATQSKYWHDLYDKYKVSKTVSRCYKQHLGIKRSKVVQIRVSHQNTRIGRKDILKNVWCLLWCSGDFTPVMNVQIHGAVCRDIMYNMGVLYIIPAPSATGF